MIDEMDRENELRQMMRQVNRGPSQQPQEEI